MVERQLWTTKFIIIQFNYFTILPYKSLKTSNFVSSTAEIYTSNMVLDSGGPCSEPLQTRIAKLMLTALEQHTCEWTPGPSSLSPPVVLSETPGHTHSWVCLQCYSFWCKSLLERHWTFLQGPGSLQQSGVEFVRGGQEQERVAAV